MAKPKKNNMTVLVDINAAHGAMEGSKDNDDRR
jgi:hypothetical protein